MSIPKVSIRQIKAARALVGWSQEELAKQAGVSLPTIKRLEATDAPIIGGRAETSEKLRAALERAGIEFFSRGEGTTGVQISSRSKNKR